MNQAVADTIISWGWIAVIAITFAMVFRCARFLVFTHGSAIAVGAYAAAMAVTVSRGDPVVLTVIGVAAGAAFAVFMEKCLYTTLRKRGSTPLTMLLGALGTVAVVEHTLSLGFGNAPYTLHSATYEINLATASFYGARITPVRMVFFCFCVSSLVLLFWLLVRTRIGREIRAMANDGQLALSCGVDVPRTLVCVNVVAGGLAGGIGVLLALDTGATPQMGTAYLLPGVLAALIGGIQRWYGPLLGALLVCGFRLFTVWFFSSLWQDTLAYGLLFAILLVRPAGLITLFKGRHTLVRQ